jgi:pSer/pThr/pTyr-binding forkhead associated (FHA) protein/outer membrane protein assembly factor BamD (BamD/ComL family)
MKLIIEDDEGRKTVVPIVRDEISIGRQEGNTIRLTERNVSRRHARLLKQNGSVYVEDLGSYNGVQVNGEKIGSRHTVKEGDLIEIGDYDLALEGAPGATDGDTNPTAPHASGQLDPQGSQKTPPLASPVPPAVRSASPAPAGGGARKDLNATAVIRLSDLGGSEDAGEERELAPGETPRLVGLSGQFRGKEFPLRRSAVRFGRTDEGNALVIDHQSISRTHGRFQLEGGAWRVFDAKSANGIRVNGDEYGMSPVKPGDTVELGHVKFRFCAPGEAFTVPRESVASVSVAEDSVASPAAGRRTGLYVGLGIGALAFAGAAAMLWLRTGGPSESDKLCAKASEELAGQRWADAASTLQVIKTLDQKCKAIPGLDSELARAQTELQARSALDEARALADAGKWKQAIGALKEVPANSMAAGEARTRLVGYHGELEKGLVADALKALDKNKLDEAKAHVDDLIALNPESSKIDELSRKIDEKRKANEAAKPVAPPPPPKKTPEERNGEGTRLLSEGVALVKESNYAGGVEKLRACVEVDPEPAIKGKCYRNMGIAYARDGKTELAVPAYKAYLKEVPNAPEKEQLLEMIRKAEGR